MALLNLAAPRRSHGLWLGLLAAVWLPSTATPSSAGEPTGETPAAVTAEELELELARGDETYLVIDLVARRASVRLRGRSLHEVTFDSALVLRPSNLRKEPRPLVVPVVWQVALRPPSRRLLHMPEQLVDEESEDATAAKAQEIPPPPETYSVQTRQGWRLELVDRPERTGRLHRLAEAVADGWQRFRGKERPQQDRLVLSLQPGAAASLHHLFRPGTQILVVAPGP